MAYTPSPNLAAQDFFTTTLTNNVAATDTVINVANVPAGTEGYLVIDPNNPTTREIIYYNSKSSSTVTTPDATANSGRGIGGTSVQTHLSGTLVEQRMVAEYWNALQNGSSWAVGSIGATAFASGWAPGIPTPSSIVANGNRSYTLTLSGSTDYTSTLSNGMRLQLTRTVAAPTQCTSLNGTTQYYNKTSPTGMTFTNNFVVSAWVKVSSYAASAIVSRYNGTSGWDLTMQASGQIRITGYNAGAGNVARCDSYQSIPLNKWVHVAAELDMTNTTNDATNNYVMIDGVNVPAVVTRAGTSPTALVQAGNLEIGSENGGTVPFPGKIAQVAIYNAKVTQATILASMNQTLVGTETSLISAYSFNNSINDLNTTNANNLTANGSAVATNADSPFAQGKTAGSLEYGIITANSFSASTVLTVQVPDGSAIPTSGGVSAVSYSAQSVPFGFPSLEQFKLSAFDTSGTITNPLVLLMVKYICTSPIDNIQLVNTGSAAGTIYLNHTGNTRTLYFYTAVQTSSPSSNAYTVNIPGGFYSAVRAVSATATNMVSQAPQYANVATVTTTVVTCYFISPSSTASTAITGNMLGIQ